MDDPATVALVLSWLPRKELSIMSTAGRAYRRAVYDCSEMLVVRVGRRRARQLHGQVLHGIARGRAILLRQGLHGPGELPRERRREMPGQRLAPGARGSVERQECFFA